MYKCANDIECVSMYDFTTTKTDLSSIGVLKISIICMALPLLSQDLSCICVLRILDMSICMILPVISKKWSCICVLRILNASSCIIIPELSQEPSCICVSRISNMSILYNITTTKPGSVMY